MRCDAMRWYLIKLPCYAMLCHTMEDHALLWYRIPCKYMLWYVMRCHDTICNRKLCCDLFYPRCAADDMYNSRKQTLYTCRLPTAAKWHAALCVFCCAEMWYYMPWYGVIWYDYAMFCRVMLGPRKMACHATLWYAMQCHAMLCYAAGEATPRITRSRRCKRPAHWPSTTNK